MAVGDIYQLIDVQRYASQQVLNVYFYELLSAISGTPTDAEGLATAWNTLVRPPLVALQHVGLTHVGIRCYNLFEPTDMYEQDYTVPVAGTVGGEGLPTFVSWGYTSPRTNRDIRAGKRRLAGVAEADVTGTSPTASALTRLNTLAIAFNDDLSAGSPSVANAFAPVIVKRIKTVLPSGAVSYRLPENTAEEEHVLAHNWVYQLITTQNSRKIGHGA